MYILVTVRLMPYLDHILDVLPVPGLEPATLLPPLLLALWWFWWRWHRDSMAWNLAAIRAETLAQTMAVVPHGWYLWSVDDRSGSGDLLEGGQCSRRLAVMLSLFPGCSASFGDVVSVFVPGDGVRLASLVHRLREDGEGFSVVLGLQPAEGQGDTIRRIELSGVRVVADDGRYLADVLWVRDVSVGEEDRRDLILRLHAATAEASRLRRVLDTVPVPVWVRDDGLNIILANRTFLDVVDPSGGDNRRTGGHELVSGQAAPRELRAMASAARASGESRSGTWHAVIDGSRRLMEITESPVSPGQNPDDGLHTVGIAQDITRLEALRQAAEQQTSSQVAVLERLGTAVAIFGADTRLRFHNPAFARLWSLDPAWLASSCPDYAEVMERQRLNRLLPEVADYPAFRQRELSRFKGLIEPMEDLLHLPDGKTLRRVLAPHPLGGLLATYEDVTDRLTLEARLRQVAAIQAQVMDALPEAVAVFDADGHIRQANAAFRTLWNLGAVDLDRRSAFGTLLAAQPAAVQADPVWAIVRRFMSAPPGARASCGLPSGLSSVGVVSLPDGGILLVQPDAAGYAGSVDPAAGGGGPSSLAELVRAPLGTVSSLCEALSAGYAGPLTAEQKEQTGRLTGLLYFLSVLNDAVLDLEWLRTQPDTSGRDVNVRELLSTLVDDIRMVASHRDIIVDCHYKCPFDLILADGASLRQCLVLVFGAALAATHTCGALRLDVQAEDFIPASGVPAPGLVLTVSDEGAGSDRHVPLAILVLARDGIRRQGGRLSVFRMSGAGTKVQIRLPAAQNSVPVLIRSARDRTMIQDI